MSDTLSVYGKVDEGGATVVEPECFIDSGRQYDPRLPSIRERVTGTPYFYRLEAGAEPTAEQRQHWHNQVPQSSFAAKPGAARAATPKADTGREESE
jgi:hypothetical protein